MNDIATIERALKDADNLISLMADAPPGLDVTAIRDQITNALMLLRQIPGQHSPTTAARQGLQALKHALNQYEAIGPSKMERRNLNVIADAARLVLSEQSTPSIIFTDEMVTAAMTYIPGCDHDHMVDALMAALKEGGIDVREKAMQGLADQAQELDMGYGSSE